MKNFPKRGEIWIVNWNPARGSEQAGRRPALLSRMILVMKKHPQRL